MYWEVQSAPESYVLRMSCLTAPIQFEKSCQTHPRARLLYELDDTLLYSSVGASEPASWLFTTSKARGHKSGSLIAFKP